ncbi:hypothetical protein RQP46_007926 [Phenoliferia psychrophenolica]
MDDSPPPATSLKRSRDDQDDDAATVPTPPTSLPAHLLPASHSGSSRSKALTPGIIYLSRLPPGLGPAKVKHLLSAYGEVGRVFLARSDPDPPAQQTRKQSFHGRPKEKHKEHRFAEGWVEFSDKRVARSVADLLNANTIGCGQYCEEALAISICARGRICGKKGSRWRDDVWTMKYLPKFRWDMLSEQVALERATQTSLLRFHLQSSKTEQESYLEAVEKARVKDAIVAKAEGRKKAKVDGDGGEAKKAGGGGEKKERERKYRQREVVDGVKKGKGGDAKELEGMRFLTILSLAATSLAAALPAAPSTTPAVPSTVPPFPDQDPFYAPPAGWKLAAPGTIYRNRTIVATVATAAPLPVVAAHQLLYRTTDAFGNPVATVTTVLVPADASPDKLMAYSNAQDSTTTKNSPSYMIQAGSNVSYYESAFLLEEGLFGAALAQVLDAIRATLLFGDNVGLLPTAKTVMWGYSGGAIATGWAEAQLASYAPDLVKNVVGGATGGTPAYLLPEMIVLNNNSKSALVLQAMTGLASGYPDFAASYYSLATPKMLDLIAANKAGFSNGANIDYFDDAGTYFSTGASTLYTPIWLETFERTKLGTQFGVQNKTLVPSIPMHLYHALADNYIPYKVGADLVESWCANGASLTFVTDTTPQVEHIAEAALGAPAALLFFKDRLAGVPFPAGCTFTNVTTYAPINSPVPVLPEQL